MRVRLMPTHTQSCDDDLVRLVNLPCRPTAHRPVELDFEDPVHKRAPRHVK